MRNKYGGNCYIYELYVFPGEGYFERHKGKWRVKHASHPTRNDPNRTKDPTKKMTIQVTLIKDDGREYIHYVRELSYSELIKLVKYDTFEQVQIENRQVMLIDEEATLLNRLNVVNAKATEYFRKAYNLQESVPIVGDVIIYCIDDL